MMIAIIEKVQKEVITYLVYLYSDEYPIFVFATELETTRDFHRFIRDGNYTVSFPIHIVKEIKKDGPKKDEE